MTPPSRTDSTGVRALSRRRFLQYSGAAVGAAAAVAGPPGWGQLAQRARPDPLPVGTGVLVVLTLYGGNDGLNTVIPAGDPVYRSSRAQLAYAEGEVLPLGEGLGLNPGMPGLKRQWDAGRLAIVRGAGYPKPDHSHFRSMDIWQTASPDHPVTTGWIGRWLDASGRDPLLAVSLEPVLPPLLAGASTAGACLPVSGLALPGGAVGAALVALGQPSAGEPAEQAGAVAGLADLHRAAAAFGPDLLTSAGTPPQDPLARQLDAVARCVEAGAPARVYSVSLGGFDTHADERATQQRLLSRLDGAVSTFLDRMQTTPRGREVVLLAYSEFGRRVAANATQGTDHGTAGPVLVAGARVRGGFVGAQPSLTDVDDGDLKPTTDFRDVYASLVHGVLGADPERVLGPGRRQLPLLKS